MGQSLAVLCTLVAVRAIILFSDKIFGSDWEKVPLAPADRAVAEDNHGAINARAAAVSWPLLTFATVSYKLTSCSHGVAMVPYIVLVVIVLALGMALLKAPLRFFQGSAVSFTVLAICTGLDIAVNVVPEQTWLRPLCEMAP